MYVDYNVINVNEYATATTSIRDGGRVQEPIRYVAGI